MVSTSQAPITTMALTNHNHLGYKARMRNNIKDMRLERGWGQEKLADLCGTTAQQIGRLENGNRRLSDVWLERIASAFGVRPQDLISEDYRLSDSAPLAPYEAEPPARVNISIYDVRAAAGRHVVHLEQDIIIDDLTFKLAWLRRRTSAALDKLAVIKVWGDSMEPSLSDGDDILIDLTQTEPGGGGVFLIRDDGSLLVKRLQKVGTRLKVISDNPAYESYESGDIEVLGRMIWQGRSW
jgi:phage repressor protein C with HTH and peptisase S24 domain